MGYILACFKQNRSKNHKIKNKGKIDIIDDEEFNSGMQVFDKNKFQGMENENIIDIYEKFQTRGLKLKNKEKKVILRGLANIGATCYMNATLQCLSNTEELTKYFLTKFFYIKEDDTKKISNEYYLLLKNLWSNKGKKKYYEPNNFKNVLSKENPLFSGVNANDSKDLLNFLL